MTVALLTILPGSIFAEFEIVEGQDVVRNRQSLLLLYSPPALRLIDSKVHQI